MEYEEDARQKFQRIAGTKKKSKDKHILDGRQNTIHGSECTE